MIIFMKGVLIGLGKILPGVSGSLIAITLGIYEKVIKIISELRIKDNINFLFKLCLGIVIGIMFGSKVIYYFLNNHYFFTMSIIIGLISSTIPNILKKIKPKSRKDYLYIVIPFLLVLLFSVFQNDIRLSHNCFNVVVFGFIDAFTMIVPGISGTAIFMMLGVYEFVLTILSSINIYLIFFGVGLLIGVFITIKIVNYLIKKFSHIFYLLIIGFSLLSLIELAKITYSSNYTIIEFVISLFFIIIGFIFGLFLNEK